MEFDRALGPVTVDLIAGTASGDGQDAVVNVEFVEGSRYADRLTGPNASGDGGDDMLTIDGGPEGLVTGLASGDGGDDSIVVVEGATYVNSTDGQGLQEFADIVGGPGHDSIVLLEPPTDDRPAHVSGGSGRDRILGTAGQEWVDGGSGSDVIRTGGGADSVFDAQGVFGPEGGDDRIYAGPGPDRIDAADLVSGNDLVHGGDGVDVCTTDLETRSRRASRSACWSAACVILELCGS